MSDPIALERDGKPTAWVIFQARNKEGLPYNWSAFCVVPDYCTGPCVDCGQDARKAREAQS